MRGHDLPGMTLSCITSELVSCTLIFADDKRETPMKRILPQSIQKWLKIQIDVKLKKMD